jgi:hypothetical protein
MFATPTDAQADPEGESSRAVGKEHDDACTIADHFDCVARPFGSRLGTEIRCRADMSAGGGSGGVAGPRFGGVTAG